MADEPTYRRLTLPFPHEVEISGQEEDCPICEGLGLVERDLRGIPEVIDCPECENGRVFLVTIGFERESRTGKHVGFRVQMKLEEFEHFATRAHEALPEIRVDAGRGA